MVPLMLQAFLHFFLQICERLRIAHILRKLIVQFRQLFCLYAKNLHGVVIRLAG